MAAANYNIVIDQGSDFALDLTVKEDGVVMPLTGYLARSQLRTAEASPDIVASFACTVVDDLNGLVKMELDNVTSSGIAPGKYVYDLELYNVTESIVIRIIQGDITLTPETTR